MGYNGSFHASVPEIIRLHRAGLNREDISFRLGRYRHGYPLVSSQMVRYILRREGEILGRDGKMVKLGDEGNGTPDPWVERYEGEYEVGSTALQEAYDRGQLIDTHVHEMRMRCIEAAAGVTPDRLHTKEDLDLFLEIARQFTGYVLGPTSDTADGSLPEAPPAGRPFAPEDER